LVTSLKLKTASTDRRPVEASSIRVQRRAIGANATAEEQ
jgi:hypothetical protein